LAIRPIPHALSGLLVGHALGKLGAAFAPGRLPAGHAPHCTQIHGSRAAEVESAAWRLAAGRQGLQSVAEESPSRERCAAAAEEASGGGGRGRGGREAGTGAAEGASSAEAGTGAATGAEDGRGRDGGGGHRGQSCGGWYEGIGWGMKTEIRFAAQIWASAALWAFLYISWPIGVLFFSFQNALKRLA
jgi:hypothetical protein